MTRAVLAIALMAGFYLLSLGLIVVLLYIPYAEWQYLGRVHLQLALGCGAAALAIALAIVPRPDRFEPPGPDLSADHQPRLLRLVQEIAESTSQPMPRDIYLLPDVNAFVSHRGGVMGVGSRRVMGIGLPLLQGLTVQQLRGVVAHEFGHYIGGDVALAPWVYKTRAAIGRAIERLGDGWLARVFNAYGRLFMRLTMAISRRQEFVADEVAARVAGVQPMKSALSQVAVLAAAHAAYFRYEVVPVLQGGYLPPVAAGFERYRATRQFVDGSTSLLDHEMTTGETGPFDSHPALRDRLAALDRLALPPVRSDDSPAATLVDDVEGLERALLSHRAGADRIAALAAIEWEAVPAAIYQPAWIEVVEAHRARLSAMHIGEVPDGRERFRALGRTLIPKTRIEVDEDECVAEAIRALGSALALRLIALGWTLTGDIGQPIRLHRGADLVEPFTAVASLASGTMTAAAWRAEAERLGIAGVGMA
jgi:Zn-dependent protease with chaperone function